MSPHHNCDYSRQRKSIMRTFRSKMEAAKVENSCFRPPGAAVAETIERRPDVAILDYSMPLMKEMFVQLRDHI